MSTSSCSTRSPSSPHSTRTQTITKSTFEALPGEIRNQIFELCILEARYHNKKASDWSARSGLHQSQWRPWQPATIRPVSPIRPSKPVAINVSVLPGWSGNGKIKTSGLGPLPLLLVNKQIHDEVSSIIDAQVEEVSIGPYGLQYADEDPRIRWECAYRLLRNRPHLMRSVKSVKVYLPWLRQDWLKFHLKFLGSTIERKNHKPNNGLTVIPGLVEFLKGFGNVSKIEISLIAETINAPNMEPLLSLYDICGPSTLVKMGNVVELPTRFPLRDIISSAPQWAAAWEKCLLEHRGEVPAKDF